MKASRRQKYTREFKDQAVKLVVEQGYSHGAAAASLGVSGTNISRWVIEREREPAGGKNKQSISSEQAELEQLRKENKRLRMEREILKKAAAFFANETQ